MIAGIAAALLAALMHTGRGAALDPRPPAVRWGGRTWQCPQPYTVVPSPVPSLPPDPPQVTALCVAVRR